MGKLLLSAIVLLAAVGYSKVGWTQDRKDPPKLWIVLPRIPAPIAPEVSVTSARGQETVSGQTQLEAELEVKRAPLNAKALLGQKVTIGMRLSNGAPRYFNGYVESVALSSAEYPPASQPAAKRAFRATYSVKVTPWLSLLRKTAGFAIYQDVTVPQVIKKVFARYKLARYELDLAEKYPVASTWVQYRETDRNFVDRLLEHVGIFGYFVHREKEHVLVLTDSMTRRKPHPGYAGFSYEGTTPGLQPISEWSATHSLRTGRYTLKDFSFEDPASTKLLVTKTQRRGHALDDLAMYDYPGGYSTPEDASFFTRLRIEELQAEHHVINGSFSGGLPGVMPGHVVALKDHPVSSHDGRYMVTSTAYSCSADGTSSLRFTAVPLTTRFRPSRNTAWPIIQGAQTAIVVGPDRRGKRISDSLGRIKVRFHWTRPGQPDEGSSAWLRVAFPMPYQKDAKGFLVPKAGQEVLVHFLEGAPDQPVVTGIMYNKASRDPAWPGSAVQLE